MLVVRKLTHSPFYSPTLLYRADSCGDMKILELGFCMLVSLNQHRWQCDWPMTTIWHLNSNGKGKTLISSFLLPGNVHWLSMMTPPPSLDTLIIYIFYSSSNLQNFWTLRTRKTTKPTTLRKEFVFQYLSNFGQISTYKDPPSSLQISVTRPKWAR